MHLKSKILVFVQFACLLYYPLTGNLFSSNIGLLILELVGILFGISGILSMKLSRVSIFPEPEKATDLVEVGIYKFIRHPMYAGILMVALSLTLNQLSWHSVAVFIILLVNQSIKMT